MRSRSRTRRTAAAGALLTGLAAVPLLAVDRLPERMATHFGLDGQADGFLPREVFLPGSLAAVAVAAVAGVVLARRTPGDLRDAGPAATILVGAVLATTSLCITWLNLDAVDPTAVRSPGWLLPVALLVPLAVAAAYVRLAPPTRTSASEPAEALDLPAGARVVWHGRITSRMFALLAASAAVVAAALATTGPDARLAGVPLLIAVATGSLSTIGVVADRRGLSIRYGPFGWPRQRLESERIEAASAIDVRPSEWGGWGYRGSLRLFRRAALVLRAGPGIRLDLVDGAVFVVTVPDAETGARLLMTGRSGSRSGGGPA